MHRPPLVVPDIVAQKAVLHGAAGRRWLDELPSVVVELASMWDLVVGRSLTGGSEAYLAEVVTRDGTEAVLKIQYPGGPAFPMTVRILEAAQGGAYARLLAHDVQRSALLLERLGPSLADCGLSLRMQLRVLCRLLGAAWQVEPAFELEGENEKAARLGSFIAETWEAVDRPCSRTTIDVALAAAGSRARAFTPVSSVVVHGDAHPANALRDASGSFKFVDPECFLAEPAYDLGVCMRDWSAELLAGDAVVGARDLCTYVAGLTQVPSQAIWEWSYVERVSTGLFALQIGAEDVGRNMLAVADLLADSDQ